MLPFDSSSYCLLLLKILDWQTSREYFYWRVYRRQLEDTLKRSIIDASHGALSLADAAAKVLLKSIDAVNQFILLYSSDRYKDLGI
jgi:hypothetical protein